MTARARLLDLGEAPALSTQTTFHAVADTAKRGDPPTLCLVWPDRPYVSIGYHQEAEREIDLAFCRELELPVIRRRIGGGAVLLDSNQIFFHLVVPEGSVDALGFPRRIDRRYERLVRPAIAAYERVGVRATFRPPNDLAVGGRKIGGTGTASIGESFVFVGSLIADFDHDLMARVLALPNEAVRVEVRRSIDDGVTSILRETARRPSMAELRAALVDGFRVELGLELEAGELSVAEACARAELDREFSTDEWLHHVQWAPGRPRKLAIHAGVRYVELEREVRRGGVAGRFGIVAKVVEGRLDDLLFCGDALRDESGKRLRDALRSANGDWPRRLAGAWHAEGLETLGISGSEVAGLTQRLVEMGAA